MPTTTFALNGVQYTVRSQDVDQATFHAYRAGKSPTTFSTVSEKSLTTNYNKVHAKQFIVNVPKLRVVNEIEQIAGYSRSKLEINFFAEQTEAERIAVLGQISDLFKVAADGNSMENPLVQSLVKGEDL